MRNFSLFSTLGQHILAFDLKFGDNITITVTVNFPVTGDRYVIKYIPSGKFFISQRANTVYFGYGVVHLASSPTTNAEENAIHSIRGKRLQENSWHRFTRILSNDLMKGISRKMYDRLYKENNQKMVIEKVTFEGRDGCITNLSLSETEHLRMFFHAADWLMESQDKQRWVLQHVI